LADDEGVLALDARIRLDRSGPAGAAHFAIAPYPAELVRSLLWQGEQIVVRPIRPEDEAQHRAFVERVSPSDLRLRFFSFRRELPRSEIARLTQIDYSREMAFIAVRARADGGEETLGVVRAVCDRTTSRPSSRSSCAPTSTPRAGHCSRPDARVPRRAEPSASSPTCCARTTQCVRSRWTGASSSTRASRTPTP
jgi:hypothetical protein